MALGVAGGADISVSRAEDLLRDVPPAKPHPRIPARWGQGERYVANVRPMSADEEAQVDFLLAYPGLPAHDDDRTALSVMTHVLGVGMSSRLFHTLRERAGLPYPIAAAHEPFAQPRPVTI